MPADLGERQGVIRMYFHRTAGGCRVGENRVGVLSHDTEVPSRPTGHNYARGLNQLRLQCPGSREIKSM